jgi:ribosomal protein S18 acetylase RimI-like enzyme
MSGYYLPIRKAVAADFPAIYALYQLAIASMHDAGIDQWDEQYPDAKILKADIDSGCSFVALEDGQIFAVFVINQTGDPEYEEGHWRYPHAAFAVIHRLCLHPAYWGRGTGTQLMLAAEGLIRAMGLETVRLDAFSQNPPALQLYRRLGYQQVGFVTFRKGKFFLFEKKLTSLI